MFPAKKSAFKSSEMEKVVKAHETVFNPCTILLWARDQSEHSKGRVKKKKILEKAAQAMIVSEPDSLHHVY